MREKMKKSIGLLLAAVVAAASLLVSGMDVQASSVGSKAHIQVKSQDSIEVKFDEGDYKISNIKSSSKNLVLRTTSVNSSSSKREYSEFPWGSARIGLYAKKKGTYTVTFQVIGRNGEARKSHSVKVYATDEPAIKKAAFAGKEVVYGLSPKAKGSFKVTMNKGYKLKSIQMTTYGKDGKAIEKKIKNGAKITLGKYRSKSIGSKGDTYESWNASLLARTEFRVSYTDKYTKELRTQYYSLYRIPLN